MHLYPKTGRLEEDLKTLKGFQVGKPVVIEETFPLGCTAPELRQFLDRSKRHAAGWMGFYWGQTPAELSKSANMGDGLTAKALSRTESELSAAAGVAICKLTTGITISPQAQNGTALAARQLYTSIVPANEATIRASRSCENWPSY